MANKAQGKFEDRKRMFCEHCKKKGHMKDKCWLLHPHLKPSKFKELRANVSQDVSDQADQCTTSGSASPLPKEHESLTAATSTFNGEMIKKSDLEALINSLKSLRDSGICFYSHKLLKPLIVDSGASHHMISDKELISNVEPAVGSVVIANGHRISVSGIGNLGLFNKKTRAFYMPEFTSNLLSVRKAVVDLNCYAIFGPNEVIFQDIETGHLLGQGKLQNGLYIIEDPKLLSRILNTNVAVSNSAVGSLDNFVWHARTGHPHFRALKLMLPKVLLNDANCEACILGKHCKAIYHSSSTVYKNCFDLVHSDVWTSPCASRDNLKYFVTFIDEKSKYTWITLMSAKDRVFDAFKNFESYIANHFKTKLKVLRTDNGGEYMSKAFQEHLSKQGIIHQTSCPYNPQQNGVAERKNRHLMEVTRSLMFHMQVPKRFWGDAVMTACYLINRTPTKVLRDESPYKVLNKTEPPLDHLRVFGCVCFVLVPGELRNKLEAKSKKCMFIGYSSTQKGYKCYDPETQKVHVSRDVQFFENRGYYDKKNWDDLQDLAEPTLDRAASLHFLLNRLGIPMATSTAPKPVPAQESAQNGARTLGPSTNDEQRRDQSPRPIVAPRMPSIPAACNDGGNPNISTELSPSRSDPDVSSSATTKDSSPPTSILVPAPTHAHPPSAQPLRRSTRIRKDPSHWKNTRVYYNAQAIAHPDQTRFSSDLLPSEFRAFLCKIAMDHVPTNFEEAKTSKEWMHAVHEETHAMERNHTWDEAILPVGKKAVSSRWVFTIKYKSNGEIERYKARLVARGFTQTYGEDYTDTFAPVAKLHTVRVLLSLATNLSWDLWQMDVKNAFLQGELDEEVYMTPPPSLECKVTPGKVLRLMKAIYGLKQSPRAWYHKLSHTLRDRGFRKSEADHTLFTLTSANGIVVVLIYVDDLIISGDDKEGIAATKSYLHSVFDIKDLGELKYFLGIEICRSPDGLFLSQRKYTLDLLHETGMDASRPAKTPLEDGYKVRREGETKAEPFRDVSKYRRLVGKLIYLTISRPDLCFVVNQVSQHMQAPTTHHWSMIERILKYLKGSSGQGIWMGKNGSSDIAGYCDADWAGDVNDRKSTTGYCTFVGGNLATWKTKKQKVVACSSAEAEYRAMRRLTDELVWLKALLKDLGRETKDPITMHCDNQAAIYIASNPVFHERTKHVEVDCHKVRERMEDGTVLPCYTPSRDQLADIFTKAASSKVCSHIYGKLGLVSLEGP